MRFSEEISVSLRLTDTSFHFRSRWLMVSLSAKVYGKTRSEHSGSRAIRAPNWLLLPCIHHLLPPRRSIVYPDSKVIFRKPPPPGHFPGSEMNPMTVYVLPRPACDLAPAIYDVGKMSRLQLSPQLAPARLVSLESLSSFT